MKKKIAFTIELEEDIDNHKFSINDFNILRAKLITMIDKLDLDKLDFIKSVIAKKVTDSSYSQLNYQPTKQDYQKLKEDLELESIYFYESDFLIFFKAKNNFPDMSISAQIENDFKIVDVVVGYRQCTNVSDNLIPDENFRNTKKLKSCH